MLSNTTLIGATTQGTTFADIIINNVNAVAEGAIQGFAQFVHDPKALRDTISLFSKAAAPKKFADAIMLRRIEVQKLDDIWSFPALAMRDTVIHKGERIAQFRIVKNQPEIEFLEVDKLENENRGGLGSTGRM